MRKIEILKNCNHIEMSFKTIVSFIAFLFVSSLAVAQSKLTLDEAIEKALANNYGIKLANQQVEVAELQIYKGNAGLLPILDWNTSFGGNLNGLNQKLSNGTEVNRFNQGFTPATSVVLNWTLYDGRRMQTNYELLRSRSQQQLAQSKLTVQTTIVNVMQTYYEILRQKKSVDFLKTVIKYYDERLQLTQQRWEIGRGSKLDYLQSKTDLTAQQATLVQTENLLKNAKVRLNNLLNRTAIEEFDVVELAASPLNYELAALVTKAKESNQEMLLLQKSMEISLLNERVAESFKLPRIALNSSLGYSLSKNTAGLFLLNQNAGLNAGVTASWNIFNGQQTRKDIETAKLNTKIVETEKANLLQRIETDIVAAYNQYQTDKALLKIEEENKALAEENLTISLDKFKLGASTILELNEAQRRFDTSLNRLVNAEYNVKVSELEMLLLSGELVR